jgi:DNA-binding transcriptional MerR regulator
MSDPPLKVGEIAERTGLSVRTLHYYEEIGLLVPSHRTRSGHRLYTGGDVLRLQQIKSLRALGLTLDEVRECLRSPRFSPLRVIEDHLARAREQLALQQQLVARLEGMARMLRRGEEVKTEEFLKTIEVMTMWKDKLTPDQHAEIKERAGELGPEEVREIEQGWLGLIAGLRAEMEKGTDPRSDHVRALAKRVRDLFEVFSGGNASIKATLRDAYREGAGTELGLDSELRAYLERAAR